MCSAVLPLIALLEQTAQLVTRVGVQFESVGRSFCIYNVRIDLAAPGCQRGFKPNDPGRFRVILLWRCGVTTQSVHEFRSFMLQRSDARPFAIVDSRSSNSPARKSNQSKEGDQLHSPENRTRIERRE